MKIYTAHWKHYTDDYYAPHNRKMFTTRELADVFLTDLMNYEHIERYYVLEEDVHEEYIPSNDYDYDDYYANQYGRDYDEDDWSVDEWTMYNDDLAWYKQQEIDEIHYDRYNHLYPIGYRDILDVDGLWFTSDEIEAFREIWQRRLSA